MNSLQAEVILILCGLSYMSGILTVIFIKRKMFGLFNKKEALKIE